MDIGLLKNPCSEGTADAEINYVISALTPELSEHVLIGREIFSNYGLCSACQYQLLPASNYVFLVRTFQVLSTSFFPNLFT